MSDQPRILNDRYQLQSLLGRGAFAEVWRAEDLNLGRPVAVKMLKQELLEEEDGQKVAEQFYIEAQTVARLNHPNIVTIHDAGQDGSALYLAMELLPGGELKRKIGKPWTLDVVIDLVVPIASALEMAHAAGMIHRDVKPQNILFGLDGRPVLTDFGLVHVMEGSLHVTIQQSRGQIIGTPQYMSPEQADEEQLDPRTDIHSLATVAYELLTGRNPFAARKPLTIMKKVCEIAREDLRGGLAHLPKGAADVVLRGMAVDAAARQLSAMGFAEELLAVQRRVVAEREGAARAALVKPLQAEIGELKETVARVEGEKLFLGKRPTAEQMQSALNEAVSPLKKQVSQLRSEQNTLKRDVGNWQQKYSRLEKEKQTAQKSLFATQKEARQTSEQLEIAKQRIAELEENANRGFLARVLGTPQSSKMTSPQSSPRTSSSRASSYGFEWCEIPAGTFTMGEGESEKQLHVDQFLMSRYPTTNEQFGLFIAADGYKTRRFWTKEGWSWRENLSISQPQYWTNAKWNGKRQPVVGVNYYEAMAYCAWLDEQVDGKVFLPNEVQWEKAARGTDGRKYPWGNEKPSYSLCNYNGWVDKKGAVGKTTDVGRYSPAGDSPYGCADMAGNVWEWTNSPYDKSHTPQRLVKYENSGELLVLRGGSWYFNVRDVRAANRDRDNPTNRNYIYAGFRCASSY